MQRKPTLAEIRAASGKTVPDIIAPGLHVLFCAINPSLGECSSRTSLCPSRKSHKSDRFMQQAERLLTPFEDGDIKQFGYGLTNIVERATARADELDAEELVTGQQQLAAKVQHYRPRFLAVLGISAYRTAFKQPKAVMGQ